MVRKRGLNPQILFVVSDVLCLLWFGSVEREQEEEEQEEGFFESRGGKEGKGRGLGGWGLNSSLRMRKRPPRESQSTAPSHSVPAFLGIV